MKKPITLSLEEELIKKIKRISINRNKGVSNLIGDYIRNDKEELITPTKKEQKLIKVVEKKPKKKGIHKTYANIR